MQANRRFTSDDEWQRLQRDTYLLALYREISHNGQFVLLDGKSELARHLQRDWKADTLMQTRRGFISIDEKIVRPPEDTREDYTAFSLETHSCTVVGHESVGWMRNGKSDYLLYCFVRHSGMMDAYWIPFAPLQEWFWPVHDRYATWTNSKDNRSRCRIVPIADVRAFVDGVRLRTLEPA